MRHDREYALTETGRAHLQTLLAAPELADIESAERELLRHFEKSGEPLKAATVARIPGGAATAEQLIRQGYLMPRDIVRHRKARTQKIVSWNPADAEPSTATASTAAEEKIREAVASFWADVSSGRQPSFDYARDGEAIAAMVGPAAKDKAIDLSGNNRLPELLAQRAALMARIKADDGRCTEIENEIKVLMGDAEFSTGLDGWKITFKATDYKGYTVPARTRRTLRITDKRPLEERPDGGEEAN